MPNKKNTDIVENLKQKVANAKSIVFAHYHGLSSNQINELRAVLNEQQNDSVIAKNTLVKIALKENNLDIEELNNNLKGPTIAVFSNEDELSGIKILASYAKENELPAMTAGVIGERFVNKEELNILKDIPGKEQLLAQVVGGLKSPLSGIVGTLGGVQRKFVYAISAITEQKSE